MSAFYPFFLHDGFPKGALWYLISLQKILFFICLKIQCFSICFNIVLWFSFQYFPCVLTHRHPANFIQGHNFHAFVLATYLSLYFLSTFSVVLVFALVIAIVIVIVFVNTFPALPPISIKMPISFNVTICTLLSLQHLCLPIFYQLSLLCWSICTLFFANKLSFYSLLYFFVVVFFVFVFVSTNLLMSFKTTMCTLFISYSGRSTPHPSESIQLLEYQIWVEGGLIW